MVVTTDVGNPANVHLADKQTVAARFALAARSLAYGERVAYQPPMFRQATGAPSGMRVWFDNLGGLTGRGPPLAGFELAAADGRFVPASGWIDGNSVLVTASLPAPRYVRYNWSNVTSGTLYNAAGLPTPTFTSEKRVSGHITFP